MCDVHDSYFYYQKLMPQCQELVQLFFVGADSSAAEVIEYLDSVIFNAKQEIMQQKKMSNSTGHYV